MPLWLLYCRCIAVVLLLWLLYSCRCFYGCCCGCLGCLGFCIVAVAVVGALLPLLLLLLLCCETIGNNLQVYPTDLTALKM